MSRLLLVILGGTVVQVLEHGTVLDIVAAVAVVTDVTVVNIVAVVVITTVVSGTCASLSLISPGAGWQLTSAGEEVSREGEKLLILDIEHGLN